MFIIFIAFNTTIFILLITSLEERRITIRHVFLSPELGITIWTLLLVLML
uniref:Uncharacterized protein n=1 Tax=Tetranychus urticae TaxID=32264 RepID=T1JYS7_TETUR